jgi:mono/diheme cytochrome c family protein
MTVSIIEHSRQRMRQFQKNSPLTIRLIVITALAALFTVPASVAGNPDSAAGLRIADGVYTSIQASRGQSAYMHECSACHMPELTGSERAPALAGDSFLRRWRGLSLRGFFERIKSTMPQNKPQSLGDAVYLDIVAFLLQSNGFPEGTVDLKSDPAFLNEVLITNAE